MEEKYVSVKPTTTIITLFERIVEMEGGVEGFDRQAIFNRVLLYSKDLTDNQLIAAAKKVISVEERDDLPTSLKVRTNCELLDDVVERFKDVFKISRVKSPFLMRVTLTAYYNYLVEGNKNEVEAEEVKLGDLRADEVSRLVRLNKYLNLLIHTDSVSIEKIKKIDQIMKEDWLYDDYTWIIWLCYWKLRKKEMLDFRPCNYIEYIPWRRKLFDIFSGLPEGKRRLDKIGNPIYFRCRSKSYLCQNIKEKSKTVCENCG